MWLCGWRRQASLRWHPDKFTHRFGRLLAAAHATRIHDRVQEVSQSINDEWDSVTFRS